MLHDLLDKLSTTQLQDLRHRLYQTDESTTVLIPVGPRAFREATLRLDKLSWSTFQTSKDETQKHVSKDEALTTLQDAIDKRLVKKEPASESDSEQEERSSAEPTTNTPSKPSVPFIEIREEVDDVGKPLRAEKIDVTDQLRHLIDRKSHASSHDLAEDDELEVLGELDPLPRQLTTEEFDKLTARMDELAMMEETGGELPVPNSQPDVPRPSSEKDVAVSKGWSKGFLNKSKQKKAVKRTPRTNEATAAASKTVTFGGDAIHEIPKEGNQHPLPSRQTRPIESSIFSGVVQERPRRKTTAKGTEKTKKVSRFAQERFEGLR